MKVKKEKENSGNRKEERTKKTKQQKQCKNKQMSREKGSRKLMVNEKYKVNE